MNACTYAGMDALYHVRKIGWLFLQASSERTMCFVTSADLSSDQLPVQEGQQPCNCRAKRERKSCSSISLHNPGKGTDCKPAGGVAESGFLHSFQQFLAVAEEIGIREEAVIRCDSHLHVQHQRGHVCLLWQTPCCAAVTIFSV